ncbi:MAG: RNA-binding protein [Kiloniellales bacterium]|nr:RNA-binding protein [Kiloniellales bacterium]
MDQAVSHLSADQASRGPQRRCIASGEVRDKKDLLRFVVDPGGSLVPDPAGRLPGRGLWLSPRRDMLEKACARNLFAKAAKAAVRLPEDLPERTEIAHRRRFLELLGLANRAGQAVAGFQKVKDRLAAGEAALLVHAVDGAEDGRRKIVGLARARQPDMPVVSLFTAAELGRALGRDSAVHLAVLPGGLAERLALEARRLDGLVDRRAGVFKEPSLT